MDLLFRVKSEYQLSQKEKADINALLSTCFPDADYSGRSYFKQHPHHRILAEYNEDLIGQLGIDFRVMRMNDDPIHVFGVVDLCVHPEHRGKGVATKLMKELERIATVHAESIDFLFLVTEDTPFYTALGFLATNNINTWLKIDQHKTLGVGNEKIDDAKFMYKPISGKSWKDGELDFLGHMY